MTKRLWLFSLLFTLPIWGQSTTVSSTGVVDTDGFTWAGGSYQISFVPNPSVPSPGSYVWTGGNLQNNLQFQGSLNSSGAFSVSIPDNTTISPAGSQWQFTICPLATSGCVYATLPVSGATQNITTSLNAVAQGPRFNWTANGSFGYGTIEVKTTPLMGSQFFNTTNNTCYQYGTSGWATCGASSGGGLTPSPQYSIPYFTTSPTGSQAAGDPNITTDGSGDLTAASLTSSNGLAIGGSVSSVCPTSYGTYYLCGPQSAINLYTELRAHPNYLGDGLKGSFGCSGYTSGDSCDNRDIVADLQNEFQSSVAGTMKWGNGALMTAEGQATLAWEGTGQTVVDSTKLGLVSAISGGTFSGTGTLLLTNFNNSCSGATATVTITSGTFTSALVTAVGSGCSAAPTTATCTSGTATCTGSPVTINVTTQGLKAGEMYLTADTLFLGRFGTNMSNGTGGSYTALAPVDLRSGANARLLLNPSGSGTGTVLSSVDDTNTATTLTDIAPTTVFGTLSQAVSGTNYASPSVQWTGSYWNGSAAANDLYTIFNSVGLTATNPNTFLTISHTGSTGAVGLVLSSPMNFYLYGTYNMATATAATSGANQSSPNSTQAGNYWTGSASAADNWISRDLLGTGTNPTSTWSITHSGSTGYASVSVPALNVASARKGTFVCTNGGTITISNTNELATSDVIISMNAQGGTITTPPAMKTVTAGTGFTVLCGATDTSTYNYDIIN